MLSSPGQGLAVNARTDGNSVGVDFRRGLSRVLGSGPMSSITTASETHFQLAYFERLRLTEHRRVEPGVPDTGRDSVPSSWRDTLFWKRDRPASAGVRTA